MKSIKKVLCLLVVCIMLIGASQSTYASNGSTHATTHFNYDEAVAIGYGTWVDTESGKKVYPIWKNKAGETNVKNNKGYTDSYGESRIFFDYKGIPGSLIVNYNVDEDKYYATMKCVKPGSSGWTVLYEQLVRISTEQ